MQRAARPTLFPYTTLFRSRGESCEESTPCSVTRVAGSDFCSAVLSPSPGERQVVMLKFKNALPKRATVSRAVNIRSEEHTSELQSQSNLVCRLLLEKKKIA